MPEENIGKPCNCTIFEEQVIKHNHHNKHDNDDDDDDDRNIYDDNSNGPH